MSSKNRKHVHKYRKVEISGDMIWACGAPECQHHMPHHMRNLIPGKKSICWSCGNEMILDERAMKLDMPICVECALGEANEVVDEVLSHKSQ